MSHHHMKPGLFNGNEYEYDGIIKISSNNSTVDRNLLFKIRKEKEKDGKSKTFVIQLQGWCGHMR